MKILILDRDIALAQSVEYSLRQDDYEVDVTADQSDAFSRLKTKPYDMLLMDIDIDQGSGMYFISAVRRVSDVPIIVISKSSEDMQKILSFEYGADDYLVKPFNILELKARMKAIARRCSLDRKDVHAADIHFDDFVIRTVGRSVVKGDQVINLTGKEYDLLYILSAHPGRVFTRQELMAEVWGYEYYGDLRSVDVHIRRVRKKIEPSAKHPKYILTKWGVGYFFRTPGQHEGSQD